VAVFCTFSYIAEGVCSVASYVAERVCSVASYVAEGVCSVASYVAEGVCSVASYVTEGVCSVASYVAEGVCSVASYVAEGVCSVASYVAEGVRDFYLFKIILLYSSVNYCNNVAGQAYALPRCTAEGLMKPGVQQPFIVKLPHASIYKTCDLVL
uniref:Uncharacterized protein n=1 Tax=Oncorhynchus tshawytscha TaxID=74940 RepID=A0AAZ3SFR7_ONCTS